jgi:hypothetical protein
MNDQDTEIRRAVHELVDAAPPAPPFPHVETVARHPRRRPTGVIVAAVAIALVVAVIGSALVIERTTNDDDTPVATTAPLPPARVITCATVNGSVPRLDNGMHSMLGRVGLPTGRPLQLGIGNGTTAWPRYAKNGLMVQRAKPFELIVPEAWRNRLRLSWGQAPLATRIRVQGCPASVPGEKWLAFAGGFYAKAPGCMPVIVRAGAEERRVRIGVGARCPGQTAPVPPPNP